MSDAPYIEAREDGWHLIDGETDSAFDDRQSAFDAIRETSWFVDALDKKPQPEGLAEPRWFDAAAAEPQPSAVDGSQVTEKSIDEMVRNLADEGTPIPFDGGGVSEVHENGWNTGAKAAGWGYVAVKALHADGRAHLWLYGAALPDVDTAIDGKSLQFGSILFFDNVTHRYTGEPIGTVLQSYALTNTPFIDGLTPHAARSKDGARHVHRTRSLEIDTMTVKKKKPAQRGPAMDALAVVAGALAIEVPAEMSEEDAAAILEQCAGAFKAEEPDAEKAAEPAPEGGEKAADAPADPAQRALLPGFDSEEAQDAFTQDVRMSLGEIFGQPDAAPAELLDLLKASQEAFKGAIGGAEPADDGASSEPGGEGEKSTRDQMASLRATLDKQGAELKALRSEKLDREIGDEIGSVSAKAGKLPPAGDELADLHAIVREVADAGLDWKRHVRSLCANRAAPPVGLVSAPGADASKPGSTATSLDEAIKSAKARITSEAKARGERLSTPEINRRAYALAVAENPHLVKQSFRAASGGE